MDVCTESVWHRRPRFSVLFRTTRTPDDPPRTRKNTRRAHRNRSLAVCANRVAAKGRFESVPRLFCQTIRPACFPNHPRYLPKKKVKGKKKECTGQDQEDVMTGRSRDFFLSCEEKPWTFFFFFNVSRFFAGSLLRVPYTTFSPKRVAPFPSFFFLTSFQRRG